jgi:sarcosine oxidase, subunit beta
VQTTAEVLIVGAGINGVATAFSLAERGMEDILIVDRSHPAAGASGRGMGLLRTYHANEAEAKLAIASLEVFRNWRQLIGGSCGFIDAGFLWLDSAANVEQVKVNAMMLARLGASTTLLTPNDLQRLQPMMRVDDVAIAAFEPAAGAALPQFATESLLAAAQRSGVRLLTHTPALGLLDHGWPHLGRGRRMDRPLAGDRRGGATDRIAAADRGTNPRPGRHRQPLRLP